MKLFGIRQAVTRQQKRLNVYLSRWNGASTPEEKLRISTDYLRTVMKGAEDEHMNRVAWDLLQFAARADGLDVKLETENSHST